MVEWPYPQPDLYAAYADIIDGVGLSVAVEGRERYVLMLYGTYHAITMAMLG